MHYEIVHLPKENWKGRIIPIQYVTDKYFEVVVVEGEQGFKIDIEERNFPSPVFHSELEYEYPDRLYQDYYENASAFGIIDQDELIGVVETDPENWANRLRITILWVKDEYHRRGIGHALIEWAKAQARREGRRAVILETQSCNYRAIKFYRKEGFTLIGMDTCCYTNHDIERKEVRLEFGWFLDK